MADRRLTHAALDKQTAEDSRKQSDVAEQTKRTDGDVWIDYVADLGDGFDATYAIAHLLAQPYLEVPGVEKPLPRAGALIMGGDEVYPTAARPDYTSKLRKPCEFACPRTNDEPNPPLLALPGNHNAFSAMKLDSHRQFLRLRIRGNEVTIFPICVDRVPDRDGWKLNSVRTRDRPSIFEAVEPLKPRLIEPAIRVDASQAIRSSQIDPDAKIGPRSNWPARIQPTSPSQSPRSGTSPASGGRFLRTKGGPT
jgi:hypothetical protein